MKLIHNYYVDFLKSFKKFISATFSDADNSSLDLTGINLPTNDNGGIKEFKFNYASKNLLHHKLYKQVGFEYPTCIINLTDIRTDNTFVSRFISGIYNPETVQTVGWNNKTHDALKVEFKFNTVYLNVRINFETGADVLNYYDRLSVLPYMFYFYYYKYNCFIDGTDLIYDVDSSAFNLEDYENLYLKMEPTSNKLKYWFPYENEPLFKINSLQKNVNYNNNEYYITFDVECLLKIPAVIGRFQRKVELVKSLEIVIANTFNIDYPILMDTKKIYIDNLNKISNILILEKSDFIKEDDFIKIKIDKQFKSIFENKFISLYYCSDPTLDNPKIYNITFGVFNTLGTNIVEYENYIEFRHLISNINSTEDKNNDAKQMYDIFLNSDSLSEIQLILYKI